MRTTSSVESLNSQIGRSFAKNPSIFNFCESLKQHEFTKATIMRKLLTDCPKKQLKRKHRVDQERDDKIKYFSSLLKKGFIDVAMFLEAMGNKTILPLNGKCSKHFGLLFIIHIINFSAVRYTPSARGCFGHAFGINDKSRNIKKQKEKMNKVKAKK